MAQDELCLDGEEWRDVVGHESEYEVSSYGRVRSKDRFETNSAGRTRHLCSKMLTPEVHKNGSIVAINHNNRVRVDELVANAFVSVGEPNQMVLHLDGDELNFNPSNLVWVDEKTYFDECYRLTYGCNEDEEWRDVVGYEGLYQVSSLGTVRCVGHVIRTADNRIVRKLSQPMKPIERSDGGHNVSLVRNNPHSHEIVPIEKLVTDAFVPCSDDKMVINHVNDRVDDNRQCNLVWVEQDEFRKKANGYHCESEERWVPVVGYEGLYEVSSLGRIRSLDHYVSDKYGRERLMHGRMLRQTHDKDGYMRVMLYKNGIGTSMLVHRIVAAAFCENENNLPEVDHINAVRDDNRASNIRYVTSSENKSARVKYANSMTTSMVDRSGYAIKTDEAPDIIDGEEWRDVEGYEGLYMVSNLGRVKSLPREYVDSRGILTSKPGVILSQKLNVNGYCAVWMFKGGKRYYNVVHRMVAKAFLDNPDNLPVVDHINGDRTDARACNLRWCTQAENMAFARENGRIPYDIIIPKITSAENQKKRLEHISKPVMRDDGRVYASQIEAARDLGYKSEGPVREVARGNQKSCRGHTFVYI